MWIDALFRLFYRVAYQGARVYWRLTMRPNRGALVMIWCDQKLLIIKNSYVGYYSLPGGNVKTGEDPRAAAVRELREEIGLRISPDRLTMLLDVTNQWEGRPDHVSIFLLEVDVAPTISVDNREVVLAEWVTKQEALARRLFPPLRQAITRHEPRRQLD